MSRPGKKAYMRTMEVMIAAVITFIFVVFIIPRAIPEQAPEEKIELLNLLVQDPDFKECILNNDEVCVGEIIRDNLHRRYDFTFTLSDDPMEDVGELPLKKIYVDSVLVAGDEKEYEPVILKMYYWVI